MSVTITLNSSTYYDAIHISKKEGLFCIEYAYEQAKSCTSPVYKYSYVFSKIEDIQEYLKNLDAIVCLDQDKPTTVDVQMDGFPCVKLNIANFLNSIRSGDLCKGIAVSLHFKKH
jgi:hypothetical protein